MRIILTEEAKKYIDTKKIESIAIVFQGCGKCNSPSRQASVGLITPRQLDRYERHMVDGTEVYVRDDVRKHKDRLVISLSRRLWKKELVAD